MGNLAKRQRNDRNSLCGVNWRTYLTTITTHYKEGYSTVPGYGNLTKAKLQRGVKYVLQRMKEVRCYAPYDGLCGYHSLAKVLEIELLEMFELLLNWASSNAAENLNVTCHFETEINLFEVINERSFKNEVCTRMEACINHVSSRPPGASVGFALYCTFEEVVVAMLISKKRGLILSDVNSEAAGLQIAGDYLVTLDGICKVHGAIAAGKLVRDVDYDVIMIMEELHWVYALSAGDESDPPHTREVLDTASAQISTEVRNNDGLLHSIFSTCFL
jgi:hypothetical protein